MMRLPRDPLALTEALVLAEELSTAARHDIRNRLGVVRNAGFFLRRRVEATDVFRADARMEKFFGLIDESVVAIGGLLDAPRSRGASVDLCDAAALAVGTARTGEHAVTFETSIEAAGASADPREIAVAIRCLLENAAEATEPGGVVRLRIEPGPELVVVEVVDGGPEVEVSLELFSRPSYTTKPGHAGLGVNVAARIAKRHGGALSYARHAGRTTARLEISRSEGGARGEDSPRG
jgi:signal transduction histidine kinase